MPLLHRTSTLILIALASMLVVSAGCASRSKGIVKGQVMFFDKKLTAGTVAFQSADGRIGSGNIDFNGNYTVYDAPLGPCSVTVRVPQMSQGAPKGLAQPPKGMPPMRPPGGDAAADADSSMIDPHKIVSIPGKYAKPETSGLNFTVEKGEQTYNITLTP
jgi:hypothetical protein